MTMPPRKVRVTCPECGAVYEDWYRPSINLALEPWRTDEEVEKMATVCCPRCGLKLWLASVVVERDRTWRMFEEENSEKYKNVKIEFLD